MQAGDETLAYDAQNPALAHWYPKEREGSCGEQGLLYKQHIPHFVLVECICVCVGGINVHIYVYI